MSSNNALAFRPEEDIRQAMEEWLLQNPGINRTALINMAIRKFVMEPQTLNPVVVRASKEDVLAEAKKAMKVHKRAVDELK